MSPLFSLTELKKVLTCFSKLCAEGGNRFTGAVGGNPFMITGVNLKSSTGQCLLHVVGVVLRVVRSPKLFGRMVRINAEAYR